MVTLQFLLAELAPKACFLGLVVLFEIWRDEKFEKQRNAMIQREDDLQQKLDRYQEAHASAQRFRVLGLV